MDIWILWTGWNISFDDWFYSMMIMGMISLFSKPTKKVKMEKMEPAINPKWLNIMNMNSCEHLVSRKFSRRKTICLVVSMSHDQIYQALSVGSKHLNKQGPTALFSKNNQDLPVVIDIGASTSISPNRDDFLGVIQPSEINSLNGMTHKCDVSGKGSLWTG